MTRVRDTAAETTEGFPLWDTFITDKREGCKYSDLALLTSGNLTTFMQYNCDHYECGLALKPINTLKNFQHNSLIFCSRNVFKIFGLRGKNCLHICASVLEDISNTKEQMHCNLKRKLINIYNIFVQSNLVTFRQPG